MTEAQELAFIFCFLKSDLFQYYLQEFTWNWSLWNMSEKPHQRWGMLQLSALCQRHTLPGEKTLGEKQLLVKRNWLLSETSKDTKNVARLETRSTSSSQQAGQDRISLTALKCPTDSQLAHCHCSPGGWRKLAHLLTHNNKGRFIKPRPFK